MFEIRIQTDDFNDPREMIELGLYATEAAIGINKLWLKRNPQYICALSNGLIKYDKKLSETLSDINVVKTGSILIKSGFGVCIDIVALDVAVKRLKNIDAHPHIYHRGGGFFHVVVMIKGRYYDPSEDLIKNGRAVLNQPSQCRQSNAR